MTRDERIAAVERAELARWYALPSPIRFADRPVPRPIPSQPSLLFLWVAVALVSALYVRGFR